jgi:hypothetical protein
VIIIRNPLLILILVFCVAVISTAQGQFGNPIELSNLDAGEASSGGYGETSITYSSSGYSSDQGPGYSFNTVSLKTTTQVAPPQTIQPGATSPAAQIFQAPEATGQQASKGEINEC